MIGWITSWAEGIIIAVVIATIIEMILPEGTSKKYIKVVIGVYILFTIISPVISKFTGKSISVSDIIDLNKYVEEVKEKEKKQNLLIQNNQTSIREIYIGNLKADIQNKLKGKGYIVNSMTLDVGYDDNYTLKKITLNVTKSNENNEKNETIDSNTSNIDVVNEIQINISGNKINNQSNSASGSKKNNNRLLGSEKNKIKEYLSSVYEISEKNIDVNE